MHQDRIDERISKALEALTYLEDQAVNTAGDIEGRTRAHDEATLIRAELSLARTFARFAGDHFDREVGELKAERDRLARLLAAESARVAELEAQRAIVATCDTCHGSIHWIECPTGGWWAHDTHPDDHHDAVTTLEAERDKLVVLEGEFSDRGFFYWTPIETAYGHRLTVHESPAAWVPHMWLRVEHSDDCLAAHLTVDQARTLRDQITAWLEKNSATEKGQADV